ncbi:hypothetical protein CRE_06920 [Caenorhabditis remanei]|uniref:Uncharacterized protein n=1 Tax=Caenorhabditis remanei TaxID=31234 RepID=E3N6K1_CAERE|nr:hypothetical protein CRE_06920 [Caenorhabditis remanei]
MVFILKTSESCIPTQNVEPVDPFPCQTCSKIYDATCQGVNLPSPSSYCLKDTDVPVVFSIQPSPSHFGDQNPMCATYLNCPGATTEQFDVLRGYGYLTIPGNADNTPTFVFCHESGPKAGMWFADVNVHEEEMNSMRCSS